MTAAFGLWLQQLVNQLGYAEIVLLMALESSLFPVPSELVMIPAGYLAARGQLDPLLATLAGAFNDDYLDSAIPTGLVHAPGHFTVDLGARWQVRSNTRLTLGLRNLLDARYAEAVGFPAPGRTLFLAVQLEI